MVGADGQAMTLAQFDRYAEMPENSSRFLDWVGGVVAEKVSICHTSEIAARVIVAVGAFVKRHTLGRVTGADGGYQVAGERYVPDVAFISAARQPAALRDAYNPNAPDLAIEVISPSDDLHLLRIKASNYLAAGAIVWVVDPDKKAVEVHTPGKPAQIITADGVVTGGAILPGFTLDVSAIFPE